MSTQPSLHETVDYDSVTVKVRCPNCGQESSVLASTERVHIRCDQCDYEFALVSDEGDFTFDEKRYGQFCLEQILGQGGFGTVYLAQDTQLNRKVALKIPRSGAVRSNELEQFLDEARAAAQLNHPGIVSVLEVGWQDQQVFIVSEFIRGETLSDWMRAKPRPQRELINVLSKIADAIDHAHQRHIIHRDLKPANILMDEDGSPKVADFGLAKRSDPGLTVSADGRVLGTPAYMSPEQAQGLSQQVGPGADIYSLGVMLFEMIAGGERPFRGSPNMIMLQTIQDDPPSPRRFSTSVSRDLETICLKCLEKDPSRRYQSAREFGDELRRVLRREPIQSRRISKIERAVRWCKRYPALSSLSVGLVFSLMLGSAISAFFAVASYRESNRADERAKEAIRQQKVALANEQRSKRESEKAMRLVHVARAEEALVKRDFAIAANENHAAAQIQERWSVDNQAKRIVDEWKHRFRLIARVPLRQPPMWAQIATPDQIVFQIESSNENPNAAGYEIVLAEARGGEGSRSISVDAAWQHVRSDGRGVLYAVAEGDLVRFETDAMRVSKRFPLEPRDAHVKDLKLSGDGSRLVVIAEDGLISVYDAAELRPIANQKLDVPAHPLNLLVSHTGRVVLMARVGRVSSWVVGKDPTHATVKNMPHFIGFVEDDRCVSGVMYDSAFSSKYTYYGGKVTDGGVVQMVSQGSVNGISVRGDLVHMDFVDAGDGAIEGYVYFESGFSQFSSTDKQAGHATRYSDFFPQTSQRCFRLDQLSRDQRLLLYGDGAIALFQIKPRESAKDALQTRHLSIATSVQNGCFAGDAFYVKPRHQPLRRWTPPDLFSSVNRDLRPPKPANGMNMTATAMAVTRDERKAVVFWMENNSQAYSGSVYRRAFLSLYELPDSGTSRSATIEPLHSIQPGDCQQRRLVAATLRFSADGKTFVFGYPAIEPIGQTATYQVYSTDSLNELRRWTGGHEMEFSENNEIAVRSRRADEIALQIYKPNSTEIWREYSVDDLGGETTRFCFDRDGRTLLVHAGEDSWHEWSTSTADFVHSKQSLVRPVAVFPNRQEIVGMVRNTSGIFSLVIAGREDNEVIQTLQEGVPIYTKPVISESGSLVAFPDGGDRFTVMHGLPQEQVDNAFRSTRVPSKQWGSGFRGQTYSSRDASAPTLDQVSDFINIDDLPAEMRDAGRLWGVSQWRSLVNYLARMQRWEEAEYLCSRLSFIAAEQDLMVQAMVGKTELYEKKRVEIFHAALERKDEHAIYLAAKAAVLTELDPETISLLRRAIDRLRRSPQAYRRTTAAMLQCLIDPTAKLLSEMKAGGEKYPLLVDALMLHSAEPNQQTRQRVGELIQQWQERLDQELQNAPVRGHWHDYLFERRFLEIARTFA